MNSKLKLLTAGLLALGVLAAANVTGAAAAEFHCTVEPCRVTLKPDGETKTAHQVLTVKKEIGGFVVEAYGFTCSSVTGEGTLVGKLSKEMTLFNLEYHNCVTIGTNAQVKMNGCDYVLGSSGTLSVKCPPGAKIEWIAIGCTATIGEQGPLFGPTFHDAGTTKSEMTVQSATKKIHGIIEESKECSAEPGEFTLGEITTGSFILTAEKDNPFLEMVNVWWE